MDATGHDRPADGTRTFVVDGETFEVTRRPDERHVHDLDWVSGPNAGYGFTSAAYGGGPMTDDEIIDGIRNFLSQVDPATGYIG